MQLYIVSRIITIQHHHFTPSRRISAHYSSTEEKRSLEMHRRATIDSYKLFIVG